MGTISKKTLSKAILILLVTIVSNAIIYIMLFEKARFGFSFNLNYNLYNTILIYSPLIFIVNFLSYALNNKLIKIISQYFIIYISFLVIILIFGFIFLGYYVLLLVPFIFLYTLMVQLIKVSILNKTILANILTLVIGSILLFFLGSTTKFYWLFIFSYFGIFHFILVLLNIKILSKMEEEKQIQ